MTSDLYRPDRIRALFDEMAATYGTIHLVSSFGLTSRWRKQCLARAALRAGATVVDLMSGMGELWPGIAKSIGSGGRIEAVDLSPVMCGRARAMWTKRNDCPAHLFEGDIFEWDFPRAAADAVVSTFGVKTFSPEQLKDAGLDMIPGGGAEVFADRVRYKVCRDKADADRWFEVHETAHALGIPSNATMLYGHIETVEERVDHILRLRALQDKTNGLMSYIPLAYHPDNNKLEKLGAPSGVDAMKNVAVGRLLLDNVPHVKAYWIMLGIKPAQLALSFGANDLDGTVTWERIYHMAGAQTPEEMTEGRLREIILEAGRTPIERDAFYNHVGEEALT